MTRIEQSGSGVAEKRVDLTYNAVDQFEAITRYADLAGMQLVVSSAYSYDDLNRLVSLTHALSTGALIPYSWTFDPASRITQATSPDGTSNYSYDDTDQLTAAAHTFQANEGYSYDANGNRTNPGHQTGAGNRLQTDGIHTYEYDAEGNRIRRIMMATGEMTEYAWERKKGSGVDLRMTGPRNGFHGFYEYHEFQTGKCVSSTGTVI